MGYLHPAAGESREKLKASLGPFTNAGAPTSEVNEVQSITSDAGTATGGTFTLTYDGQETAAIDFDATAAEVDAALEALSNIDAGQLTCAGGPLPGTPITVNFGGINAAEMTIDDALLTVPTPAVTVVETTAGEVGVDEVQTISVTGTPDGGTFTLTFDGQETGTIAYNASAATIDTALEALSNIEASDLTCAGGPLPGTPVTVTFGGTLAATDVALMTADDSLLTRTTPEYVIATDTGGATGSPQGTYAKGALLSDTTNGKLYINTGTADAPTWTLVGGQS